MVPILRHLYVRFVLVQFRIRNALRDVEPPPFEVPRFCHASVCPLAPWQLGCTDTVLALDARLPICLPDLSDHIVFLGCRPRSRRIQEQLEQPALQLLYLPPDVPVAVPYSSFKGNTVPCSQFLVSYMSWSLCFYPEHLLVPKCECQPTLSLPSPARIRHFIFFEYRPVHVRRQANWVITIFMVEVIEIAVVSIPSCCCRSQPPTLQMQYY